MNPTPPNAPGRLPAAPAVTGDLGADAAALERRTCHGERLLGALPPKPERNATESARAGDIHDACRAARQAFLGCHAERVYDTLTAGRTRRLRLGELSLRAAEAFPGLVPTGPQLAAERRHIQAHKEGREVDQGIFFGALLRIPSVGTHLIESMLRPAPASAALLDGFRRSGTADLGTVLLERRGRAAFVTFRNGHCLNAEDDRLIADLETAVDLALLDDQVRVGVLRGGAVTHQRHAGKRVFSAGVNLKALRGGEISFVDFLLGRELGYINKMLRGLLIGDVSGRPPAAVSKPWVGVVDSFAIGGGMQLLLVLDRVIAEEGAWFGLPAADEGIVPGLANLRLTRLVGARMARQIVLSGRRLRTGDPEAALLCDETVPTGLLDDAVERAVADLSGPGVAANRGMLVLAEEPLELLRGYLAEFAVVQAERLYSADVLARLERRWTRP